MESFSNLSEKLINKSSIHSLVICGSAHLPTPAHMTFLGICSSCALDTLLHLYCRDSNQLQVEGKIIKQPAKYTEQTVKASLRGTVVPMKRG